MTKLRISLLVLTLGLLLWPLAVSAQDDDSLTDPPEGSAVIRVNGLAEVAAGDSVDVVVSISGDANIAGTVNEMVFVIDGDATISGQVDGDVTVIGGTLNLLAGSSVDDVFLVRSDLVQDPGATVTGEVTNRDSVSFGWRGSALFSALFWGGSTIFMVVTALLFAAVGGRQLATAGGFLSGRTGKSIVSALLAWFFLPIIGVFALVSILGIPIGLSILLLLLPVLFLLGYIVAATRFGAALTARIGRPIDGDHPYLAAFTGVIIFQLIGLIPFVGGAFLAIAALFGSGGLVYLAWRAFRSDNVVTIPNLQETRDT